MHKLLEEELRDHFLLNGNSYSNSIATCNTQFSFRKWPHVTTHRNVRDNCGSYSRLMLTYITQFSFQNWP